MKLVRNARRSLSALLRASQVVIEAVESRIFLSASVSGTVYYDLNGDGVHQSNEPTLQDQLVYADLNNNGAMGCRRTAHNNQFGRRIQP